MLKAGRHEHLTAEALGAHLALEVGREQLDDDLSLERGLGRQEQAAHTAGRELVLECVALAECVLQLILKRSGHCPTSLRTRTPTYCALSLVETGGSAHHSSASGVVDAAGQREIRDLTSDAQARVLVEPVVDSGVEA